jgi:hypothetical protein
MRGDGATWPGDDREQCVGDAGGRVITLDRPTSRSTTIICPQLSIPLLAVGCIFSDIDQANVGFAALTMNRDLGLSATQF